LSFDEKNKEKYNLSFEINDEEGIYGIENSKLNTIIHPYTINNDTNSEIPL